jgi:predicted metalloprotease with PDZ domain
MALAIAACARTVAPSSTSGPRPSYVYEVTPPAEGSWTVEVDAQLEGAPSDRLVAAEAGIARVSRHEGDCTRSCRVHYAVDLDAYAAGCRRIDCARRVGDSVIGSATAWLLLPEPAGDAAIHVDVRGDASRFATGLRRDPRGGYGFAASELGEASYTAFGSFRRAPLALPGATLQAVLLGQPLAMGDAAVTSWLRDAAGCVASLYGRFPVDATVFVVPVQGADEVVFGRVMSLSGASVALLFGSQTQASFEHDDWVVVHELSHLGTASFMGEGHWLEEGLATYYEPILRERAGWMTERQLWEHFVREMPRGVPRAGEPPDIEERDDTDSTYWGGALFAFLADMRTRTSTQGARSLDDAMRGALARLGDATHEARLADFLRTGDDATGTDALAEVDATFAQRGQAPDLEAIWRSLGVESRPDGTVVLHDDAPLAAVRRGISLGAKH